jgi:hypothetical protein
LPGDCGVVSGRVFMDNNSNCATNTSENNVPATVVRLEPGPYFGNTNSSGQYSVQVPYGTYEVFAEHPVLEQSCPVVQVVQQAVNNNVHVPMEVGAQLDMQVTMSDGAARPGFEYQVAVQVNNLTADAAGTVSLMLEHDALLGLVFATPAPTTTAGNVLTWTGADFSCAPSPAPTTPTTSWPPPAVGTDQRVAARCGRVDRLHHPLPEHGHGHRLQRGDHRHLPANLDPGSIDHGCCLAHVHLGTARFQGTLKFQLLSQHPAAG